MSKNYFKKSPSIKNTIEIEFDKIFNRDIAFLNNFHLNKKRAYCNIIDIIVDSNNKILELDEDNEIIFNYLSVKYKLDSGQFKTTKEFVKFMYEALATESLKEKIVSYVDENYEFDLDSVQIKQSSKFKDGLQFTDAHNKILFQISTMMKFVIPLVLHNAYLTNPENLGEYLLICFDPCFEIFSGNVDLINKLYESVYSRVIVTRYSDRPFWYYTEVLGMNIESLTDELCKKLIHDLIPKYTFDKNPISLNHVAIIKNIEYAFRFNFPLNYKSMNLTEPSNDNNVSDFDKLSVNTARINEAEMIINKVNIKKTIKTIIKKFNIQITKEEVQFYSKGFKINKLQKNFLFLFFAKYFGSAEALYYCNLTEYVTLLIIMKKILTNNNFTYLNEVMTSKVEEISEKKSLNKKNYTKIIESEKYNQIINEKYPDTFFNIMDSNIILKFVATLMNNTFVYHDYQNDEANGGVIEISEDIISEELLRFMTMI